MKKVAILATAACFAAMSATAGGKMGDTAEEVVEVPAEMRPVPVVPVMGSAAGNVGLIAGGAALLVVGAALAASDSSTTTTTTVVPAPAASQ